MAVLAAVLALHAGFIAILTITGTLPPFRPALLVTRLIMRPPPPSLPPPLPEPAASAPTAFVPLPEIRLASPPPVQTSAIPRAPLPHPASHFGTASDSGLALDVAVAAGGGAGARGTVAGFEAAVRHRVLADKHQPALAWDRRRECVVNYRVQIDRTGALAGLSIDPCAVPEINEAARAAIRGAAPYPLPPDTAAATSEVSGTLIFHP